MSSNEFNGFSQQGLQFLVAVRQQNSKEWFDAHRSSYDDMLLLPTRCLVTALSDTMLLIDKEFCVNPVIGKTISRLHRDTRFSRDKSRYRSRIWITFKRESKDWKDAPVYFFEISPEAYRYGIGYYSASRQTMDIFRELINSDPQSFMQVAHCCQPPFELHGECYKRPLVKDQVEAIARWYNRKSFAVMNTSYDIEALFNPNIVDELAQGFKALAPLYYYLMEIEQIKRERGR